MSGYEDAQDDLATIQAAWETIGKVVRAAVSQLNDTSRPSEQDIIEQLACMKDGFTDLFYPSERRALNAIGEHETTQWFKEVNERNAAYRQYVGQP